MLTSFRIVNTIEVFINVSNVNTRDVESIVIVGLATFTPNVLSSKLP